MCIVGEFFLKVWKKPDARWVGRISYRESGELVFSMDAGKATSKEKLDDMEAYYREMLHTGVVKT